MSANPPGRFGGSDDDTDTDTDRDANPPDRFDDSDSGGPPEDDNDPSPTPPTDPNPPGRVGDTDPDPDPEPATRPVDAEVMVDSVTPSSNPGRGIEPTDPSVDTERPSVAGDGPLASVDIPGTDTDLGGGLDALSRGYRETVADPFADLARRSGERDIALGPAGAIEGSERRGQLAADASRSVSSLFNIPGAAALGVRAVDEANIQSEPAFPGGPVMLTGDPDRTERQAEAGREAAEAGVEFAAENPDRAGAFALGGVLGGVGVGAASRTARVGIRGVRGGSAADDVAPTPAPESGLGGRGTGSVLDPADVQQPASNPAPSSTVGRFRRDLDDLLGDERGQLGAGRQRRRRPDTDDEVTPDPTTRDPSREIVEGSPRDRISSDITGRQRSDLDATRGTFDAGDAIDPIGTGTRRTTGGSRRIPRDPLDTSGGRSPPGGGFIGGIGATVGTGAALSTAAGQEPAVSAFDDDLEVADLDTDTAVGPGIGPDTDIGPDTGADTDTTPRGDQATRPDTAQRPPVPIFATADVTSRFSPPTQDGPPRPNGSGGGGERIRPPGGTPTPTPRPRPDPDIDFDNELDEDLEAIIAFGGATFENPTTSLQEASEAIVETTEFDAVGEDVDNLF
jgi:hypothetical protein